MLAVPPRKIRQLPPALPPKESDVFPISQMDEQGTATTRAMTRAANNQAMIDAVAAARQGIVDSFQQEQDRQDTKDADLQSQIDGVRTVSEDNLTQISMLQEQIANGSGGKNAYQLWAELPGNQGKSLAEFLESYRGATGSMGPIGPAGPMGDRGDVGPAGGIGPMGPSGNTGERGEKGDKGDTGATGPQGATGSSGATGPKGDTGATGAKGDQGIQGVSGQPGAIVLGEVDIVDTATVALSLGVRSKDITVPASWGMRTTDTLFITPATSLPSGYAVDNAIPLTTTSIRVYFVGPALALLASNTLRIRVAAIARTS